MAPMASARFHFSLVVLSLGLIALLTDGAAATPLDETRQLVENGRYAEAEAAARKMLGELAASGRGDSLETAQVLDVLLAAVRQGKSEKTAEALPLAERSLAIKEALLPADHPDLASGLNTLGTMLNGTGDYARARALNERALAIREKTLGPDHLDVAKSLSLLANSLSAMGDYAGASQLHERAVAIRERALGPEHVDVARSLIGLATQATKLGDFDTAQPLFERALGILERELGPEDPSVAICLNNYANMLSDLGDNEGAIRLHERALAIREKAFGPKHVSLAMTLNNLGNMLSDAGNYADAARHLERAKTIWEGTVGPAHPFVGMVLDNLGSVHARMSDIDAARALHEQSLAVREQALGSDHPDVALSLVNLANLLRDHGKNADYARADSLYVRALAIRERTLSPDHPLVAIVLNDRSVLLAMTGAKREALDLALRGEAISRQHLWLVADGLAEREMMSYATSRPLGLPAALSIVIEAEDPKWRRETWDAVIRSRAIVLDEMAARHRAGSQAEGLEIPPLREGFATTSRRLANLIVRGPGGESTESYRQLVDEAREERERAERALVAKSAAYREEEANRRMGLAEVAAALPPGSALVAYSRYERLDHNGGEHPSHYLAFAISGQAQNPDVVPLGPAGAIDTLVSQWLDQAGRGILDVSRPERAAEASCRTAGTSLRRKVWDPVAAKLAAAELVFIVPDGALHQVNFAALPDGASPDHYLVESAPVFHYLSAERDLIDQSDRVARGEGLLALGGPDFEATSQMMAVAEAALPPTGDGIWFRGGRSRCGNFAERRFEQLPAAAREAAEVSASWNKEVPGTLVLTGAAASEAAFKREAAARRILHLATHGFFIRDECRGENPLLLSGLALAGANHRDAASPDEEDGILTAEEIAALDLERTEWTVLSGCDTGVGEMAAGEGVLGLRRAFEVAGAKTLIMSLWPVDDESTREWMRALYERRFRDQMETARGAQEASRAVLRARRERKMTTHPFHWGGFVAAGAWK